MFVPGVTQGEVFFLKHSLVCDIIASTCFISCISSLMGLALVTLHHHVIIFNSWLTDLFEGYKYHSLMCVVCWVMSFMAEIPNYLLWGKQSFNEHSHQCMWDRTHNRSYTVFACIFLIATPLVLIFISHIKIIAKVFREERNARIHSGQNRDLDLCPGGAEIAGSVALESAPPVNLVSRDAIVRYTPAIRISSLPESTHDSTVDIQELDTDGIAAYTRDSTVDIQELDTDGIAAYTRDSTVDIQELDTDGIAAYTRDSTVDMQELDTDGIAAYTRDSTVDIQELDTDGRDVNGQPSNVTRSDPVVRTTVEDVDIQTSNESSRPAVITTAVHRARRLGTTLMVMALAYLVCWMPFVVVNLSDTSQQMPIVHLWVTFLAHAHAFVACIAYMMTNSHFTRAFKMRSGCFGATITPTE